VPVPPSLEDRVRQVDDLETLNRLLRQAAWASTRVVVPPARTLNVPGGTQALRRTQLVEIRLGDLVGQIPRPTLLGAILIKARAVEVDDVPDAQLSDLAFLLSLVEDPRALAGELRGKERTWLRRRRELHQRNARVWHDLLEDDADNAHISYCIFTGL